MKKLLPLVLLLLSISALAQGNRADSLLLEGSRAYETSDFQLAKEKFEALLQLDSTSSDAHFNLGASLLSLNQLPEACRALHRAYALGDEGAYNLIVQYCGELPYTEKMFSWHVDELPQFSSHGEFLPLIPDKKSGIHPDFLKLLRSEMKKSPSLKKFRGKIYLLWTVDIHGQLQAEVKGASPEINQEFLALLQRLTQYRPASYKGRPVGLWSKFALPMTIN